MAEYKNTKHIHMRTHFFCRHLHDFMYFAGHSPPRRVHPRREDEQEQDEGEACFGDGPGALLLPPGRRRGRGALREAPRTHTASSHVRRKAAPAGVRLLGDRPPPIICQLEKEKKSPESPSAQRCRSFGTSRIFSGVEHGCSGCVLPIGMFLKHHIFLPPPLANADAQLSEVQATVAANPVRIRSLARASSDARTFPLPPPSLQPRMKMRVKHAAALRCQLSVDPPPPPSASPSAPNPPFVPPVCGAADRKEGDVYI